ncbi:hypothetical protein [Bacillus sp. m3-13]|uniref:hypothetical protein n=1 Tax=Bacillus sp. m3-13 TaxID=406124 RepID=UPI00049478D8|nr:hypothetical protein [Bacillus sp. m3-13]
MKINCMCCRRELRLDDNVVIDEVNSLYHADCYGEVRNSENLIEWKDFGTYKDILDKHKLFGNELY